ncbi:MAG: histidinol-phosphate transaminase [Bacteroidetes bacterium]|nr:histidinol-phosphate transaminase [Bacteroidota bacterium]
MSINTKYDTVNYTEKFIRLAQNENPYGTSPKAISAIQENLNLVSIYPDVKQHELRQLLADKSNVDVSNIVVGAGSVSIIETMIKTFVSKDEHIVIPKISFTAYKVLAEIYGVDFRIAEMNNYRTDLSIIGKLCDEKTKLVFLANPNNPTGTTFTHNELKHFLDQLNPTTLAVIDEAYFEYVNDPSFPDSLSLLNKYPNVIILRSFSKIYGLAGLRIGYGIAHQNIVNKIENQRTPFTINILATVAAMASLNDIDFITYSIENNEKQRNYLYSNLKNLGFNVLPSQANFLYLYFYTKLERDVIYDQLIDAGLQTRKMEPFGDEKALRISIGDENANLKIIACLSH